MDTFFRLFLTVSDDGSGSPCSPPLFLVLLRAFCSGFWLAAGTLGLTSNVLVDLFRGAGSGKVDDGSSAIAGCCGSAFAFFDRVRVNVKPSSSSS